MQAVMRGVELDLLLLQLEGGPFEGRLFTLRVPPLFFLWFQIKRPLHATGEKPKGVLSVTLDLDPQPGEAPWRSHGLELPVDSLFGVDVQGDVHFTIPANVNFAVVFLPIPALEQWALRLGWLGFDGELLPRSNVVLTNPRSSAGLRRYLRRLFALAEQRQERLLSPQRQRLILDDLIPLLLEALCSAPGANTRVIRPPARIEIVKDAQRWLHTNPTSPITLADLCREVHASRRTLLQGFQDHLGMGPMAYVKLLRLHGIRRQLVLAEPGALQITALADAWGFHNAGHFAADYRRLFGEAPRDTLRRSRPRLS
jgi:AraC family ethanolamine operon transcriptional activator